MKRLLFVGDISVDLTLTAQRFPEPDEKVHCSDAFEDIGGVVTNAAVAAARAGAAVMLAIQVGTDPASAGIAQRLAGEGLHLHIGERAGAICRVVTVVEPHGEKRLLLHPGVSLYPDDGVLNAVNLEGVSHIHTAIYGPSSKQLIARAKDKGIAWSLDLEPATFPDGIETLRSAIDGAAVLFVNDRAAQAIGTDAMDGLFRMGAASVVRTEGPRGATLFNRQGVVATATPPSLPIVDTTGAGDCLAGWYLAGLSRGETPPKALAQAVRAATIACGALGAQAAIPTRAEFLSYKEN
ncbi:carbohydrate kinase family protein [Acidisoma silvae]|uniref:Carbohydrate kinase family protein n=1 Tax=Acidisoma silvae TaxID=2802396 RepID=A0A964E1G1_9PROT|nr:carbohydrate kinase family protein [Acidisoma silvae]MCB8877728.1 carbohydrate kinase family protein [Acidisoma silvae]